jgi:hypothetical protein
MTMEASITRYERLRSVPILPDLIEGHLVVVATNVFSPVKVGDIVLSVDSVSALDYLGEQMELHSGSEQWRRSGAMRSFELLPKGDTVSVSLNQRSLLGGPDVAQPSGGEQCLLLGISAGPG